MGAVSCIGQTLIKGLAVDYAIGQAWGVLGGIFAGVEAVPPPAPEKPASTVSHQIKHTSFWAALAGAVAGAVVAAAASAAAVALFAATGGAAVVVSIGAVLAAGPLIGKASSAVAAFVDGMFPADDGPVMKGSDNVFINGLPAARAGQDTVACVKHSTPPLIAEGSETVLINGWPAARLDDKTACGAALKQGCTTVLVGGPPIAMVPIDNEFSLLERALLVGVEFLIPPSKCLTQGLRKLASKGAKLAGAAFKAGKNMIMNGLRKGPQLVKQSINALKNQAAKLKGALKNVWAGMCNKCKPNPRKPGNKPGTNSPDPKACKNDPIDTSTGAVVDHRVDFELGHTLRLRFSRSYDSQRERAGLLGRGWVDSFGEHLVLSHGGDLVELHCADGEVVPFDIASDTDRAFNRRFPHFTLIREAGGFAVHDLRDDRTRHFQVLHDRGRLVRLRDPHGNHVEFEYSGDRMVGVRHSDGPALRIRHAEDARKQARTLVVERVDRAGARLLARYVVERDLLVEAESTTGNHFYYQYHDSGRLARWADTALTWVTYEYDAAGRCVATRAAGGLYSGDFTYNDRARITRARDSKGRVTEYHFDDLHHLICRIDPLGNIDRYEYDRHGQLVAHTDPRGHTERHAYDGVSGLPIRHTDREGRATEFFYDDDLRPIAVVNALGQAWHYTREPGGRIASVLGPDGTVHEYAYNARGQIVEIRRSDGATRRFDHDPAGRLTAETDWLGNTHHYSYDSLDRLIELRDPLDRSEHLFYDPRDRLTAVRHADQSQRNFAHDGESNLIAVTDENGHTERAEFGAFDLQRALVDGEGRRYEFSYDPDSVLLSRVRAPDGRDYHLERDAAGRLVRETDYHGSVTRYTRDPAGNVVARTNAAGQTVRYQYDKNGELARIDADGETTLFERDALGRLVRAENPACKLTWEYDAAGCVIRSTQNGEVLEYTHDPAGHCTGRTLHPGPWQAVAHATTYAHNAQGRLTALELAGDRLDITRDPLGNPTLYHGAGGYRLEQAFDERGSLVEQRGPAGVQRRYTYDGARNLTAVHDARWGSTEYRHDRSDRVVRAARAASEEESFRYDRLGLLAGARAQLPGLERDEEFRPGPSGRLQHAGDSELGHDEAGRVVRKVFHRKGFRPQIWEYRWDSLDHLVEVHTPDGQLWRYSYDPLGRRVRKHNPSTRETVLFLWDGDVLLREIHLRPKGPQHDEKLVRIVHWQHEPGTFVPLAKVEDGRLSYVVTDQLGTPRELVNPHGQVLWRTRLSVWGQPLDTDRSDTCPIRFQGQYEDAETGLFYNRFRYYDPGTALYLSPDPIGLLGGLQPGAYVHNPFTWVDPLGLAECGETINVVRAGVATPQQLQTGVAEHVRVPGLIGFSVQSSPGKSVADLAKAGGFPNKKISVTTLEKLEKAGFKLVQSPGKGHHMTVETSGPLSDEQASLLSSLFEPQPNPFPRQP